MLVSKIQNNLIQQRIYSVSKNIVNPQFAQTMTEFPKYTDSKYYVNINFRGIYDDNDDYEETPAERRERERLEREASLRAERNSLIDAINMAYGDDPEAYARMRPVVDSLNRANGVREISSPPYGYSTYSYENPETGISYSFDDAETRNRIENTEMSYADRMSFLDRLERLDFFDASDRNINIAPELRRQLRQMDKDDFKAQGRRVIEALGGAWMVSLKEEELLPDMKINGVDYYMTNDGRLYADTRNCPEYPIIDEDYDEADDYYDPMFDEHPNYIWVNGFGKVNMRQEMKECKSIRSEQTTCHFADINYYFRVLEKCKAENYDLRKDVNGIYYAKVPGSKWPWLLRREQGNVYMNLRDGSWHTENSEVFSGMPNQRAQRNRASADFNPEILTSAADSFAEPEKVATPAPPPFKTDRIERELTSIDPAIKSRALNDLTEYVNSDSFDPNFKDDLGRNIIHLAMISRDEKVKNIISRAISKGIDINAGNKFGQTPLMVAIKNFITSRNEEEKPIDLSNIKFILDQNPDINIQDNNKQTAFHLACMTTSVALLTLILSKNPNVLLKDKLGKRAADYFRTDAMKEAYKKYIIG